MENAAFEHLLLTSMANRASRKNTKRFKSGRFVTFVLGILIAIFMVNAEVHANPLGTPIPNGFGFSMKLPLNGMVAHPESAEWHMFALHNRNKTMRLEAPAHGRFVRFKFARMKYIMRFPRNSGMSSASNLRANTAARTTPMYKRTSFSLSGATSNSIAVAPPAHYVPQEPVTASGAAMIERNPEHRSKRAASSERKRSKFSKNRTLRIAHDFARRYAIMRENYIKLRTKSPRQAHKAYKQLMKFYKVAQWWQQHTN